MVKQKNGRAVLLAGVSVLVLGGVAAQAQTVTWGATVSRPPDMMRPEPAFRYRPDPAFSYRPPPAYSYRPAYIYTSESASRSKKAKPPKPAKTRVVSIRTYAPARPRPVIEVTTETKQRTEIIASTPPKPVEIKTEVQPEVVAAPAPKPVVEVKTETAPPQIVAALPTKPVETTAEPTRPKIEIASPSLAATPAQPKREFKIESRRPTTMAVVPPAPVIPVKIEPLPPAKPIIEAKAEPTQPPETTGTTLRIIREENGNAARNSGTGKKGKKGDEKPALTSGQLHIIVSIDHQRATLYSNGHFVTNTKVSTGTKTHPTPLGVFSVLQKNRHHVSNLYDAPMPYMQRLTWSGTAMHTGPLPGYPASHGCIRLTDQFAQLLWKATKIGARVIVTRDDVKPVEFAHMRLLVPKPKSEQASAPAKPLVRTADATSSVSETKSDQTAKPANGDQAEQPVDPRTMVVEAIASSSEFERRASPVSIFVSRKDGKLYVRQAMQPLFDVPVTLRDPLQPIGTHVYTAMELKDGAMRWTAVTIPSGFGGEPEKKRGKTEAPAVQLPPSSAAAALERFEIPAETAERLATMLIPGSSLIVSDNGIGGETGLHTDFIVLTR
jgi:lipoprotein-anchoring transpeptidase ErfK/SrfK